MENIIPDGRRSRLLYREHRCISDGVKSLISSLADRILNEIDECFSIDNKDKYYYCLTLLQEKMAERYNFPLLKKVLEFAEEDWENRSELLDSAVKESRKEKAEQELKEKKKSIFEKQNALLTSILEGN